MALWRCTSCTCAYAVGLPRCPQCAGTEHEEDGAMPKAHKGRPPTDEAADSALADKAPAAEAAPLVDVDPHLDGRPRPSPRRRNHTRAQAGVAAASGKAKTS